MAKRRISIFDNFLSGGKVGNNLLKAAKAELKASTLIRSLVAWAVRYLRVARRLRRRSSRDNPAHGDPAPLDKYASSDSAQDSSILSLKKEMFTLVLQQSKYRLRYLIFLYSSLFSIN